MSKLKGLQFPVLLFFSSLCFFSIWTLINGLGNTFILEFEFFSNSSLTFSFSMIFDKISTSFGMVVTLIAGSVFTFAHKYMEEDHFSDRFLWILMAFVLSMNFLTWSGSLLFLLLGWDGLGITSFALIIYYQSYGSLSAGYQTLMVNRVGDALIVLSTFLFVLNHQFSYFSLDGLGVCVSLVLLLSLAALTKSAQYPFSSWLPAAMAAPTPVSALVHSSTLVTAGIFLIIRLSCNLDLDSGCKTVLVFVGAITCLLGGWAATYENDLKKIIALSTLSQLGVMMFSLGLGLSNLALFHLYTHALFKALLFLAAGQMLMASYGSQDIRLLGSVGLSMPFTVVMFNVSSLCLIGAPFLSAFYSKHLILEMMVMSSLNVMSFVIMLIATMFTAKYVIRSLKCISWSKPIFPILAVQSNFYTTFPVLLLSLGGIMGGKFFSLLELNTLESCSISSFWGMMINLVTLTGLIWGMTTNSGKSFFLSTMFFLSPSLSTKPLTLVVKELSCLDHGWLEPSNSISYLKLGSSMSSFGIWPKKQVLFSSFVMSVVIMYLFLFS
uniref:NADH-ubiquinone oxidoreductase chain 5 n=1 Tax=Bullacta caurina TaxID=2510888 RepID=A0A4D6BJN8_9GAST|nr:NADH dehydrogenase subunit 5 [Bullacta caurina]QBX88142.1 NADH dehydrogenase subunit 5 [Bullacta caurina]